jgi:hypothetical protein
VRQLGTDKVEFSIGSEGTPFLPERKYTDLTTPGGWGCMWRRVSLTQLFARRS